MEPYVNLNWGRQPAYPQLQLPAEPPEDVKELVDAVAKLVPVGLRVRVQDLYRRLRLTEPAEDDVVLEPGLARPAPGNAQPPARLANLLRDYANAAAAPRRSTDVEGDLDELIEGRDWEPIMRPLHDAVQEWAERMGSLEEAQRRLPELLRMLDGERAIEQLAADLLRARGLGDLHFGNRTG